MFASVNGTLVPGDQARVSVLDNGFAFGDSVYETLRTYGGRPFHLDRHLLRLRRSADRIGFDIPLPDATLSVSTPCSRPRRTLKPTSASSSAGALETCPTTSSA